MILQSENGLRPDELREALRQSLEGKSLRRVLLLPPDYTRMYSGAGMIVQAYWELLDGKCEVDIMPALGTHEKMSETEWKAFFGPKIPYSKMIVHNWREDVVKIGEVPASFVSEVSEGLVNEKIDVEVNRRLVSGEYDLIISIGQVVPHEVVGMANYSKNIFVGCGGSSMISSSHMLGAFYGLERVMGKDFSPVRRVFDYAEENFLASVPLMYVLTCCTSKNEETLIHGLFIGRERALFEAAVKMSQEKNLVHVAEPFKKVVVYLDPREFKSTWLGNKAIYRTRMAIADGGELIILAPGVRKFGEDDANDKLIRKYGYVGRERVLELVKEADDLKANLSVAAHLIHGSSDGRFHITYCTKELSEAEVRGAAFGYVPYDEMAAVYDPAKLTDGWNTVGGEEIFYISNPALGLWTRE
ncbi:MAG: lactate racemase domain-containing protein [Clostridia bacterium]|nr:lactate racemase domain-containing protein [Clostridia bacterium]